VGYVRGLLLQMAFRPSGYIGECRIHTAVECHRMACGGSKHPPRPHHVPPRQSGARNCLLVRLRAPF